MNDLYIVSTPIGNLQDITIRAIDTLFSVGYVLAEQTSKTSILLDVLSKRYPEIVDNRNKPKVISFNEYQESQKIPEILGLLKEHSIALVSEAGTPLISDPGYKLVNLAQKKGARIIPIPGASSVTASLSVSGLPTDKFLFLGFLPRSDAKKATLLKNVFDTVNDMNTKKIGPTVIFFESPHKLISTLKILSGVFGNIQIVIEKELTKIYESVQVDFVNNFIERFEKENVKGEYVILLNING